MHLVVALHNDGERIVGLTVGDNDTAPDPEPLTLDRSVTRAALILPHLGWWAIPGIEWHLPGTSALLGLRVAPPWKAQCQRENGTKDTPVLALLDDVTDGWASIPSQGGEA
ncbi:MAG: hypothetical protein V3U79_07175, partial [Dehalococcoidia bacterium]